ncbi:IKK1 [Cordylochernes scorpioides]|uniref:IKK1 n=1 Tax=Cordylochernes scorpioides TaxID=51811 RepID=A0ABY6LS57_9ARAC|nr:IKK1 [Cordylochernes scorpioides]
MIIMQFDFALTNVPEPRLVTCTRCKARIHTLPKRSPDMFAMIIRTNEPSYCLPGFGGGPGVVNPTPPIEQFLAQRGFWERGDELQYVSLEHPTHALLDSVHVVQAMIIMQFDFALTNVPEPRLVTCTRCKARIHTLPKRSPDMFAIIIRTQVVNGIGKKREAESNGQKFQVDRPRPVRTPATVSKVKRLATTENPPSQRQLSRMCGTSLKTINNIIHKDLELDTRRKGKVHKLTPFHMKNRATNARKLYEEHLAGSRSEYTATLDEAWMYVTYCNGIRKICYIKRGNQVPDNWVHHCSETFPKGFMVVGVMTGRGVLPLIKVPSKVKVNSEFYIECVLKPVIEQLKDLYPGEMDKVFLHHDKASSHTSNKTQQFLQEMKDTLGLNFIRNSDIPVKSPDASPLDFYGFGMLKQRLFNRRPKTEAGLWKAAQEEWSNVSLSKVKEVFAAWKVRCREIAKKKGKHIEHMKKIHVRKIKF